ncbi:MAG: transcriptional regulator [Amycolatopsis sp.]|jgi:TetR/AcrR family transcriptional repressor of mexJK operon|uniref:TetR/AcrR family transcriptional regulator n=1 Tax=Amycolatopsis sp. TaxID=37632 RepID=UPI002612AD47|nr:TetR/AcrR family transcriptional regulator [Amycolatopsis sp.]MCU1682579.1 transcriptional regulator [Amycolatopsis sp.]
MASALEVFLAEGFDVSVDRIAAVAEVSKVTVYNHFGCKEDLFRAVIDSQLDEALESAESLVEYHLAITVEVRTDLLAICRAWVAGLAGPEMIALRNLVAGESRRFPELGDAWWERGPARLHTMIADALRKLVDRGLLEIPDVDLGVLQLSGLVLSPHQVYGSYGHTIDDTLSARLTESGVDMFLSHYRA